MNEKYLTDNLITYIGNKRKLLNFLDSGFQKVISKLNKDKITALDGFSGSGIVSRLLKKYCSTLYINDLELYSYIINKCYLSNVSMEDYDLIVKTIDELNNIKDDDLYESFITKNYSPIDDNDIKENERVFYTHKNAVKIDSIKRIIFNTIPEDYRHYYLAPLLVQASIHTNTSGVFKGFHKKDGIGHFGGKAENCLERIKGDIHLEYPIFFNNDCDIKIYQKDINELVKELPEVDMVYYDPPYNQHPYGSNYFMLNIIANENEEADIQDGVSGIIKDWNKSNYNKRNEALESMDELIKNTKSKYILISYNNEGIIPMDAFESLLKKYGNVEMLKQEYNTYRGSRNLNNRNKKVDELLWILEKK